MTDRESIGRSDKRVEDPRLLRGEGRFIEDVAPTGTLAVHFVRAPHAHARIARLNVERARAAPHVVDVLTGAEVRDLRAVAMNTAFFPSMKVPRREILATEFVAGVGAPIAAIIAESEAQARDALDLIDVEYEILNPLSDLGAAMAGAPSLFPELGTNCSFSRAIKQGDVETAFAAAATVVRLRVAQQLLASVALETRGIVASFDRSSGELNVWIPSQAPSRMRTEVASLLDIPEGKVRVVSLDVGGAFGLKASLCPEQILVAFAATRVDRPVKWISTRSEDLLTTPHGRGAMSEAELALSADGGIAGLRVRTVYPLGANLTPAAAIPAWHHLRSLPGAYRIPACDLQVSGVFMTTIPTAAYRGAGRPEAAFVIERLMEVAARALSCDPAELRRKNFIPSSEFPYRTATGQVYDSGNYEGAMNKALRMIDYTALRDECAAARRRGDIRGVGMSTYVESCASGWESGTVRVERTGSVTAITGSGPTGQGHETTFRQIVSDFLGIDVDRIIVRHGDTQVGAPGFGTLGSRSTAVGGGALAKAAAEVREKAFRIAASMLEVSVSDLVAVPGGFQVQGAAHAHVRWAQVAEAAYRGQLGSVEPPGLEATVFFNPEGESWGFGCVIAAVHIDPETGQVAVDKLCWVDDAGNLINPLLVEGQLHGGLAQGYGQAMLEEVVYDGSGQLLTGSLMDYAIPRAEDVPVPVLGKTVTPSPRNPLGAKGVGEAGCIGVPPAIVNAVLDALAPFGIDTVDMPLTSEKIWTLLRTHSVA